jgi:cytochrome c6
MLQGMTGQCVTHRRTTIALGLALLAGGMFFGWATKAGAQASAAGADPYKTKCIACHGGDGSGNTPVGKSLKSADLRSPEVQKKSDAELAAFIAAGKGNMPAFRNSTSDDELHAIVAHVRTFAPKKPKKAESKKN